ncbi:TonB-dependent receptor [Niabella drilacis]|uniref:Outer membrane receptor proteins, mostly Fe transport n=1 Tax=Niabella drilacis (strain DSM 25811 / CCM 8410 / CCUG 62505 / LMG 26954 / E90) TaxID=1285928 RepID=A0A1G6ZQ94_NIADE|nr:TonB-dependent receptor [Niabella drilacis]SDE04709.1 Outer membrane receptor proteins, mostly Fe transport [Niabella drilacis]
MTKRTGTFFIAIMITLGCLAQDKVTLSGTVRSAVSGETLISASVELQGGETGTVSNEYGFYSLTLPGGEYNITYSAIGFEPVTETIRLTGNKVHNVSLQELVTSLDSVQITANARGRTIRGTQMGVERLTMKEINTIPMLLGERDILKAIQLLPGIKSAGDGNSGFYVRGGSTDQNLILLDEANVYNASHLMGFFSTFNSDIVKDVTVYKGGMPAPYGGRLSSVLDVKMNEGNNQRYAVSGGVGLISAKLNVEGPIQENRSSFLVSGRRTYADLFLPVLGDSSNKNTRLFFYDVNAKMNYTLGKKDRLFLSGYFGRDVLKLEKQFGMDWGNKTGTLRWNHIFNDRLFSNTSFIYSDFNYNIAINNSNNDLNIFSQIRDLNLKEEIQWYAGSSHSLRLGFNSIYHTITPGEITSSGKTSYNNLYLQDRYSWENALFASDTWKTAEWLNITFGLRLSSFAIFGPGDFYEVDASGKITDTLRYAKGALVKNYWNLEPRLAASFILNNTTSVKASYVRNTQNLHLIANSAANFPTDKWIASTNSIRPEIVDIYSVGWYKNLPGNRYELTTEAYYKSFQNQIDYRTGADVYTNDAIETQLLSGIGRAYGLEMLLKKKQGRLTGWVGYTLSKTERKIGGINDGEWYNARQDRTHDVAIVTNYQLNNKWNLSANWVYYTGDAVTFPSGKYVVDKQIVFYYTKRNAYRMPAYHRLDLGATRQLKTRRKNTSSELAFSLFNAYGRENAYLISFQQNKDDPDITEVMQTSLFRFVPSVSWHFKF